MEKHLLKIQTLKDGKVKETFTKEYDSLKNANDEMYHQASIMGDLKDTLIATIDGKEELNFVIY